MIQKFTLFKMPWLALVFICFISVFASGVKAQVYNNGPLSTGTVNALGVTAPTGYTWSEFATTTNTIYGFGHSIDGGNSVIENFTVTGSWSVSSMSFFGYSTGNTSETVSPFNRVFVRIYNADPAVGNPTPIFGDLTTNRFATSTNAFMYRITRTESATTRRIWQINANVNVTLPAGNYWVEYQIGTVTTGASNFGPPVTITGQVGAPGGNARQRTIATGAIAALLDGTAPQEMPFIINYATSPCSGTPAPGNTLTTAASICSNIPYTLSLQNVTAGSGVSYQWQSSATGAAGSFTNIAGATSSTYSTTGTVTTWYQAVVTCGANTGTSTPVQVTVTPCYCTAGATSTAFEKISRVTFGTINNPSTSTGGYEDFTAISTDAFIGATMPITVTLSGGFAADQVKVWIDFNRDFDFDDAGELVYTSANGVGPHNGNITIPSSVTTGTTRMRIRMHDTSFGANGNPCGTSTYGQVEDYTVNLIPCVPVTVTTQPVNRSIACGASTTFTATLAGSLPVAYWEYRTSATGIWQNVPNAAPYSGVNTTTLTINPVTSDLNGYQYRVVYSGVCNGVDFSSAGTLTVTAYAATVTPTSATICNGAVQQLSITNTLGDVVAWTENFDVAIPLPTGWVQQNLSAPLGPNNWLQGNPTNFPSFNGAPNSYITALWSSTTTTGVGTISNWLFTPVTSFKNGDMFKFYTRTSAETPEYPDRIEVRISTNGASTNAGADATTVGDFTTLLLTINPTLVTNVYPKVWTEYTATVSGVTGTVSGRAAFRYFVTNAGGAAPNSNVVGIDNVRFVQSGSTATGTWTGPAGTIFTNAAATTAYVAGTPLTSVYVKPTVAGVNNYSVVVATPTCTSNAVIIPVTVNNPITGTSTVSNATVCVGGNTSFTASAPTGGNTIVHQWQVKIGTAAFTNIANGGVYNGATTNTLTITGATATMNGYIYRDSMSVAACNSSLISSQGTLTVNPLPVLTVSANPTTAIYPGQTTTLSVASSTTVPPGGYQWYLNGVPVAGETNNTLVVDVDDLGAYTVTAADANACGNAVTPSITITSASSDILFIYPSPNSGQFQVRYYSAPGNNPLPRYLNIYDSKGSRVYSRVYPINAPYARMDVDLSSFNGGIYQVELSDRNGARLKVGRVLVQK